VGARAPHASEADYQGGFIRAGDFTEVDGFANPPRRGRVRHTAFSPVLQSFRTGFSIQG